MISEHTQSVVRRAKEIYESRLRTECERLHSGKFLAIEPDSGESFLGETMSAAIQCARAAYPDRISFCLRIGHEAAVHMGELSL
jgi:hypothetical protein